MISKIEIIKNYLYYKNKKYKSRSSLENYQTKKIKRHLKFVTKNSEFYKKYESKELKEFPVINKQIMMQNFNALNTVNIDKNEALEFAIECEKTREFAPKLNNITIGLSSGTSNTRGIFLVSDKEKNKWAGYILAKYIPKGILKKHRIAFFMRADSNLYEAVKSKNIIFEFFDIYKPMEENIEKLKKFNVDILVGQPSVLLEICRCVEENNLQISPEKVVSIAEVLEKRDEEHIKKILKQDIIHQVYQCTEGCLATTCEYGTIHLNEDIVHIEKEYINEKRFVPIITDFSRTSQPIIRYRLNDILIEKEGKCKCGSCCTAIKKIEGREDDLFIFKNKEGDRVKVFPDFIRRCILFADDIEEYRVMQLEDGNIKVFTNESDETKEKIKKEFENLSKEMDFILPNIEFSSYEYNKKKKLKRVESIIKV